MELLPDTSHTKKKGEPREKGKDNDAMWGEKQYDTSY